MGHTLSACFIRACGRFIVALKQKDTGTRVVLFRYKRGKSFLHRTNAAVKLIGLLALSLCAPLIISHTSALVVLVLLCAVWFISFYCGFSVREQVLELLPLLVYLFFLYVVQKFAFFFSMAVSGSSEKFSASSAREIIVFLKPDASFIQTFFVIILLIQISFLFFKTTSSIALRDALCAIEETTRRVLRKNSFAARYVTSNAGFAKIFAVFLSCIPSVFEAWQRCDRAWRARQGKNGIQKIRFLLPVFFSLCFHAASLKARSLAARE